ncbi:MAG: hypothetical protein M1308_07845 [Actinobacteria bacterium]|nr:hypothetical protein [Actinomycetota bacterium]
MKNLFLSACLFFVLLLSSSFAQDDKISQLETKINQLEKALNEQKDVINNLMAKLIVLDNKIDKLSTGTVESESKTVIDEPVKSVVKEKKSEGINTDGTMRCQATTKKGTQCKRNAQTGSRYCWQHQR